MANCLNLTKGRKRGCKDGTGGYKNIYVFEYDPSVVTFTTTGQTVTAISGLTSDSVFLYELKANTTTNSYTETVASSSDNRTTTYSQVAAFTLQRIDADMQEQLHYLNVSDFWLVIEDTMGNFILSGKDFGAEVTESTIVTGAALTDLAGYTISTLATEKRPSYLLTGTAVTSLLANVASND